MAERSASTETFRLNVDFNGMCLFVPEESARKMHVLMPKTRMTGMPRHHTRIAFDAAHLRPGQEKPDNWMIYMDLDRVALILPPDSGNASADPALHPFIAPIHQFMNEKVHPNRVQEIETRDKVANRVTLTAGRCGGSGGALKWTLNGPQGPAERCLTNTVRWIVDGISGTSLPLSALRLKQAGQAEASFDLATLHAVGKQAKSITIKVYHLPLAELPPATNNERCEEKHVGTDPSHFHGFSEIFDREPAPWVKIARCECDQSDARSDTDTDTAQAVHPERADTGSLLTCMLASSALT